MSLRARLVIVISLTALGSLAIGARFGASAFAGGDLGALAVLAVAVMTGVGAACWALLEPLNRLSRLLKRQLSAQNPPSARLAVELHGLDDLTAPLTALLDDSANRRLALQNQLTFLQNLIDTIPSPVFYKDAAFRYLGCNRSFEDYIGFSRSELLGKSVFDIAPPELARIYQQADQDLWEQGGSQVYETSVKYADGSVHQVIFFKNIFRNAAGEPAGMLGLFHDITARKESEALMKEALAATRTAEEKLANILRSVADGLVVTDRRNRIIHLNAVAAEMVDVDLATATNQPFTYLFKKPELRRQAKEFLTLPDPAARLFEFHLPAAGGRQARVVQAHSAAMRTATGEISGLVTLLRDVSRERELDRIKSEFISTAAHELRTPLSVVLGYAELLLNPEIMGMPFSPEQQQQSIREIYRKGEALTRIVDDLFDISRMEAGLPLPLELAACDLNAIVGEVAGRYRQQAPRHHFNLNLAATCTLLADENRLSQVVENLISNAVKYSPDGGEVQVSTVCGEQTAVMTIADRGIGMTAEQLARIFDKFYRADSSNTSVGGLGIGMSIVRMIIEELGGTIEVTSRPGEGTRAVVTLPVSADPRDP